MSKFGLIIASIVTALSSSCGGNSKETQSQTVSALTDQENAAAAAFSVVDEATDALAVDTYGSTNLELIKPLAVDITRACSKNNTTGVVTVTRELTGSRNDETTNGKVSKSFSLVVSGKETRTWTPNSGGSIACEQNKGKVDWSVTSDLNGMVVEATIDRSRASTKTLTTPKKQFQSKSSFAVTGSRTITFGSTVSSGSTFTREKTIVSSVSRTKTFQKNGTDAQYFAKIATKSDDPLKVSVTRSTSTKILKEKKIKSGTLIATDANDGSHVDLTYADVLYSFDANTEPCMPKSGQITGKVFAKDATAASSAFTIKFGATTDSTVSITFEGKDELDYPEFESKGCELESET